MPLNVQYTMIPQDELVMRPRNAFKIVEVVEEDEDADVGWQRSVCKYSAMILISACLGSTHGSRFKHHSAKRHIWKTLRI